MKLERIHVERYGAWRNLDLPVDSDGISVYYGPNEAGKTTLMRFIRGVLYGYRKGDVSRPIDDDENVSWGGALQVEHCSESWMVRRIGQSGTTGLVTAWPAESDHEQPSIDGSPLVRNLTGGVGADVFENIFAIGLYELQELATLESHEVAEQIYSLSLGLDGQELLDLIDEVETARDDILDVESGSGRLATLYEDVEKLDQRIEQQNGVRRKYDQLCFEQEKWQDTIVEQKHRQQGLESQLHGHEYMERVHEPWQSVRRLEREISRLPALPDFPEDGLANLREIETELAAVKGRRNALINEAQQFRSEARQINVDGDVRRYAPAMRAFVDQRDWISDLVSFTEHADEQAEQLENRLEEHLEQLGDDWTLERLRSVDISHVAGNCLSVRGTEFRDLNRRSRKLRRRYQRLAKKFHRRKEQLARLREQIGEGSIEQAIELTNDELNGLEDLSRLRIRESELTQRKLGIANQIQRLQVDPALPEWVYAVLWAIAISGSALAMIGLWTGLTTNVISGICFALVGTFSTGMAYALKRHFEGEYAATEHRLLNEQRELELRLHETRDAISRTAPTMAALQVGSPDDGSSPEAGTVQSNDQAAELRMRMFKDTAPISFDQGLHGNAAKKSWLSEVDLLRECLQRLRDLEQMSETECWVDRTRHQLIEMRQNLRDVQRDFGLARRNWCTHLVEQGLDETIEIDDAMNQRDLAARAALIVQRVDALNEDVQIARRMSSRFGKRIKELGHQLQRWDTDYSDPLTVVDDWEEELTQFGDRRREQRRLKREAKSRRAEASKYRSRIRRLEAMRDAILVRGGAVDLEDFEERAGLLESRFELDEQLKRAKQELAAAASGERAMAVVESDLENYDEEHNRQCIETIRTELEDLAIDLEDAFENLGRYKREIELLENDTTSAEIRFDREQLLSSVSGLAEEWFALEWSLTALEEMRIEFEKNHQPPILAAAREYLARLSGDRYTNIWTPLGRRTLCVDDRDGNTLMVEHLSGGTREQLFLAIRLSLIEHFSNEGAELPVVLDDILVNFDEERTQAALDELLRQTGREQQILYFTCHQHLAEMFRRRGVSTVTLPDRRSLNDELLAG